MFKSLYHHEKCLMEPPQFNNTGEEFQELKINENRGNEIVVERVDLQRGNIYSISGNKMFVVFSCVVSYDF